MSSGILIADEEAGRATEIAKACELRGLRTRCAPHGPAALELAPQGITVNAVCPGLIDTEMVRSTISDERAAAYAESFPISRLGEPSEVAELVAFLASDRAAYITGASLDINGGDLMI